MSSRERPPLAKDYDGLHSAGNDTDGLSADSCALPQVDEYDYMLAETLHSERQVIRPERRRHGRAARQH